MIKNLDLVLENTLSEIYDDDTLDICKSFLCFCAYAIFLELKKINKRIDEVDK